jgi:hypothetical protein
MKENIWKGPQYLHRLRLWAFREGFSAEFLREFRGRDESNPSQQWMCPECDGCVRKDEKRGRKRDDEPYPYYLYTAPNHPANL